MLEKEQNNSLDQKGKGKLLNLSWYISTYWGVVISLTMSFGPIWSTRYCLLLLGPLIIWKPQTENHTWQPKYIALILLLIIVYLFVDCLKHKVESKYSSYGIKRDPQKTFTGGFDIWTSNQCSGSGNEGSNI